MSGIKSPPRGRESTSWASSPRSHLAIVNNPFTHTPHAMYSAIRSAAPARLLARVSGA